MGLTLRGGRAEAITTRTSGRRQRSALSVCSLTRLLLVRSVPSIATSLIGPADGMPRFEQPVVAVRCPPEGPEISICACPLASVPMSVIVQVR